MADTLEIVRFDNRPDSITGFRVVQVALNGELAVPCDIHESEYREMSSEDFKQYLIRTARSALNYYGDARVLRRNEDGTFAPAQGA